MRAVFFDLGDTLVVNNTLVADAQSTLQAVKALRDPAGQAPEIGLISDYKVASTDADIEPLTQEYYALLDTFGIRAQFEPVSLHVTLSTEVKFRKPDKRIFLAAMAKLNHKLKYKQVAFITENLDHIKAARDLGMMGICVKGGQNPIDWDVLTLSEVVPILETWMKA